MSQAPNVLERSVFHTGKIFIRAGEANLRAHVIQKGTARSFIEKDGEKIEVARYGPGTIIGEACLIVDDPLDLSYEAVTDLTVISITRQDFEKKLNVADNTIKTILRHIVDKAQVQEKKDIDVAVQGSEQSDIAQGLVHAILAGMSGAKKEAYQVAITPPITALINSIHEVKARFKSERLSANDDTDIGDTAAQDIIDAAAAIIDDNDAEEATGA